MIVVRKSIVTETAHRLLGYDGKCARIHGHSYKWEVEVLAPLQQNGISMDFKDLKDVLRKEIEVPYDHMLVLHQDDHAAQYLTFENDGVVLVPYNPTAENFVKHISKRIESALSSLDDEACLISLTCWETENSYAKIVP